ncbi:MAG: ComF family protein [Lepagella sp.]
MKLPDLVSDFIFPRYCHVCGVKLADDERYVCPSCLSQMPRTHFHRTPDNAMERRFMGLFPYRQASGHFFYSRDAAIATLMHDLKYHRFRGLARFLGEVVGTELFPTGFLSDIDMILPIPMHFLKQARRGYNQTVEIARGISAVTDIPVARNLCAVRGHRTQTLLSLEERVKNTEGIFRLRNPEEIDGKNVLILDDVCTTGTTLATAAITIHNAAPGAGITLLTLGVTF